MKINLYLQVVGLSLASIVVYLLIMEAHWFEHYVPASATCDDLVEVGKNKWLFFIGSYLFVLPVFVPYLNKLENWLARMMFSVMLIQCLWILLNYHDSVIYVFFGSLGLTNIQIIPNQVPFSLLLFSAMFLVLTLTLGNWNWKLTPVKIIVISSISYLIFEQTQTHLLIFAAAGYVVFNCLAVTNNFRTRNQIPA